MVVCVGLSLAIQKKGKTIFVKYLATGLQQYAYLPPYVSIYLAVSLTQFSSIFMHH